MSKRKSTHLDAGSLDAPPPRRSARQRTSTVPAAALPPSPISAAGNRTTTKVRARTSGSKLTKKSFSEEDAPAAHATASDCADGGRQYWLMRAEPETRLENGVDVSFSIDDLAARTEPEPWDGIRNYMARNNLRAMKKGDLAFFSHSNCKEPGIVGTMEIVMEHSPDLTAHDPKAAYYDPKSSPSDPKWSLVYVEFRSKFAVPVTVKEMREMAKTGGPLENMQMMKQSRLSVSRVSESEWEHLMGVAEKKAKATA